MDVIKMTYKNKNRIAINFDHTSLDNFLFTCCKERLIIQEKSLLLQ